MSQDTALFNESIASIIELPLLALAVMCIDDHADALDSLGLIIRGEGAAAPGQAGEATGAGARVGGARGPQMRNH